MKARKKWKKIFIQLIIGKKEDGYIAEGKKGNKMRSKNKIRRKISNINTLQIIVLKKEKLEAVKGMVRENSDKYRLLKVEKMWMELKIYLCEDVVRDKTKEKMVKWINNWEWR